MIPSTNSLQVKSEGAAEVTRGAGTAACAGLERDLRQKIGGLVKYEIPIAATRGRRVVCTWGCRAF